MKSEKGSITVLSFVTVMFILIILGTLFYSIVEKSKSQVIEMEKLSNTYDGDMGEIYKERKGKQGVYATLYSNGSLVFTNTNRTLTGKGTPTKYGDVATLTSVPWEASKESITRVEFIDKVTPTSTSNWFSNCTNLTTIIDMTNLDTNNVTNMNRMFYMCQTLTILDLSNFNTNKVTNIGEFLSGCTNIANLNMKNFNLSNATTYNDFISNLSSSAVIKTNETMATWLRTNFSGVSGNIQVV